MFVFVVITNMLSYFRYFLPWLERTLSESKRVAQLLSEVRALMPPRALSPFAARHAPHTVQEEAPACPMRSLLYPGILVKSLSWAILGQPLCNPRAFHH